MKKNRLFISLALITTILLFTIAASCNFCGTTLNVGEESTSIEEEELSDQSNNILEQSQQQNQNLQDESSAPTIILEIIEGPLYSAADDVCYWRIKSTVTGNPKPEITWSKDDSGGTLGENIAQVNLNRDNPKLN